MENNYPLFRRAHAGLQRNDAVLQQFGQLLAAPHMKNADSTSVSPIVAQRLEPSVMEVFVKEFPLYNLLEKVPSNGLSHTYLQQTAFSSTTTPHTLSETGTVTDDANVYLRKTTNIAQLAVRRGVTLKAMFAGMNAGAPASDLMAREIDGGLLTLMRDAQMEMLRFQESDGTSTTDTAANGKYDANGMNGLRYILNNLASPENNAIVDVRTTGWTDQRVLHAVRTQVNAIIDKGGKPDLIVTTTRGSESMFLDQMQLTRIITPSRHELTPGFSVQAISTDVGELPVVVVPGGTSAGGLGTWVDGSGFSYFDIFILQTDTLEIPYLGAPEATIIRIPIGTDGQLRELAIIYCLLGLAAKAPQYLARVSCRIA